MHPTLAAAEQLARTLPPGRKPTRLHIHVLAKLCHWRSATPTHRALARAAGCCRRTVLRALSRLRALGLLSWQSRTVCGRGWAVRIANAYVLGCSKLQEPIRIHTCASLSHPPAPVDLTAALRASEARAASAWAARRRV